MTTKFILCSFIFSLLAACSHTETTYTEGETYAAGEYNIAIFAKTLSKDKHFLDLHAPQAYRVIYFPFVYSRSNGKLQFIRYCQPMEMEGYGRMMSDQRDRAAQQLQSVSSIEKSCNMTDVKLVSFKDAGRPIGGRGGPDNRVGITANIFSPKNKQWERQSLDFPELPKSRTH